AGVAALFSVPARAQQASAVDVQLETHERAALLAQTLPEAVRRRSLPAVPPIFIASSGVLLGFGVVERQPAVVAGGAVGVLGGIGFYLTSEQRDYELLNAAAQASLGLAILGLPFEGPRERWQTPIGTGYLLTSGLGFLNFVYSTQPGR